MQDVDIVLTTREMDRLMRMQNINVFSLPEAEFDSPLGIGSGAGVIFGATGGVMEAALRTAYHTVVGRLTHSAPFAVRKAGARQNSTSTARPSVVRLPADWAMPAS